MTLPVLVQPRAEEDLRAITTWWSEHRLPEEAARWWDGIVEAIESLGTIPERCRLAREDPKFPYDVRELHYGLGSRPTHRVLFTIRPESVVILTVRHSAQANLTEDDI